MEGQCPASHRAVNVALFALLAAAVLFACLARDDPDQGGAMRLLGFRLPALCFHRRLTGRACPGCGMTRAVVLLAHGRLHESRLMHPSGPWLGLWIAVQLIVRLALCIRPLRRRAHRVADVAVSVATLALVCYLPVVI